MDELSTKRCVSCEGMRPMLEETANLLIAQVPGWKLVIDDGKMKLHRSWKVHSFMIGLKFLELIANAAEVAGHHPELHLVNSNIVNIDIWTRNVGGLTENDFILAAKIDRLKMHRFLRRIAEEDLE